MKRDMVVAMATPITPSFGAPNNPKINTAFSATLQIRAIASSTVLVDTFPMHRRTDIYTAEIAQKIRPGAIRTRYFAPISTSVASFVYILIRIFGIVIQRIAPSAATESANL